MNTFDRVQYSILCAIGAKGFRITKFYHELRFNGGETAFENGHTKTVAVLGVINRISENWSSKTLGAVGFLKACGHTAYLPAADRLIPCPQRKQLYGISFLKGSWQLTRKGTQGGAPAAGGSQRFRNFD
jgi:hypothetical protein